MAEGVHHSNRRGLAPQRPSSDTLQSIASFPRMLKVEAFTRETLEEVPFLLLARACQSIENRRDENKSKEIPVKKLSGL